MTLCPYQPCVPSTHPILLLPPLQSLAVTVHHNHITITAQALVHQINGLHRKFYFVCTLHICIRIGIDICICTYVCTCIWWRGWSSVASDLWPWLEVNHILICKEAHRKLASRNEISHLCSCKIVHQYEHDMIWYDNRVVEKVNIGTMEYHRRVNIKSGASREVNIRTMAHHSAPC